MRRASWAMMMLLLAAAPAWGEVLPEGWTFRRPIAFKQVVSDAPGENIAWAEFFANGAEKADASDLRVTTADRFVVPHKILQAPGSSDLVRIAFATRGDGPYYVWWGNPRAEAPARDLEVKRGILLDVARNNGPAGRGGGGTAAIDLPPGPPLGSFILPEVSLGYNPAGSEQQIYMHYSGQFKIDRAITAQIAFTVNDLGVLAIDGKEIARELKTGLRSQVRQSVPVDLAVGWHTLDIRQVNQAAGNVVMALAWQRPGEKVFSALPASLFAQAARGTVGALEKPGAASTPDFTIESTAEGFLPPSYYAQRYTFEALVPAGASPRITWDFGDGQTATNRKVTHAFLSPGLYTVSLKIEPAGNPAQSIAIRLPVRERMYERFPRPPEDPPATLRPLLKDYKPEKLTPEQAFRGMLFFESADDVESQIAWGMAWLNGRDSSPPPDGSVFDEATALGDELVHRKQFRQAAEVFALAAAKNIGMDTRTKLMRQQVMILCDFADEPDAGMKAAQDWLKKVAGNRAQTASAQGALAWACIARGDGKSAKAAIDAAVAASPALTADLYRQREIRQGVLTRNVENYIQGKDYAEARALLNQWELEFPAAIWDGFTRTLRVKLLAAEGNPLAAARTAVAHARANPDGFYAAELLFRAADNFKAAGNADQARAALDLLSTKYPESPYARQGK